MKKSTLQISITILIIILLRLNNVSSTEKETKGKQFNYWIKLQRQIQFLKDQCVKQVSQILILSYNYLFSPIS